MVSEFQPHLNLPIPFYQQHYDFTCGPACLMMAMKYLDDSLVLKTDLEIDIWREANLVAVCGTSRFGLAFSAATRGYRVQVTSNTGSVDFVERLEPQLDDEAMALLKDHFFERRTRCRNMRVREEQSAITAMTLWDALRRDHIPLIVTSTRFYSSEDLPHWVVVTGIDDTQISFLNPADREMQTRGVRYELLDSFIGYRGDQSMIEVWKE